MKDLVKAALEASKAIQFEVTSYGTVPDEGLPAYSQQVLPKSLFANSRGYIEKVVNQINGCYEKGWFDACAVMIRRLVETLIIECFEKHKIATKIQGANGDFLYLSDLIHIMLAETSWNLGRNTMRSLPKLKNIGDKSAHSRRFTARRWDIDKIAEDIRVVAEELVYLAGLK
jgi:hypothetical protein